jgi:hypothetical protein
MFMKFFSTLFLVILSVFAYAQNPCGYERALKEQLKDPLFKVQYEKEQDQVLNEYLRIQQQGRNSRNVITIPVVVHILYRKPQGLANLTYDRIKSQIEALNKYFDGATIFNEITNSHPYYKAVFSADCDIQFVLANKDPNGNPTTGVVRKRINAFLPDDKLYTDDATGGSTAWNTQKYLNIYVVSQLKDDDLGVYYPSNPGELTDVVFVKANSFGKDSENFSFYNGLTCAHEVGHWLSLEHIFGFEDTTNTFCGRDLIYDTPQQTDNSYSLGFVNGTQLQQDNCASDVIINNLSGAQHIVFDDKYKRGLFGSSSGLGFFQSSPINNNSITGIIPYNDNALNWSNPGTNLWYPCANCTTKTVRDIIRTKDGAYWIAMAANGAQAQGGGIFSCSWNTDPGIAFPTQPTLNSSSITTGQDARYCRDLSADSEGNIYGAFSFYLSGVTQFEGKLGKYTKSTSTWQFTDVGMAPAGSGGVSTRNVLNVHCDTLNNVVYATTQQAFIGATAYGPYLLKYTTDLGFLAKKDFVSVGNINFRGIATDKLGRVWAVYNFGTSSVLKVYDNALNELLDYPLSSLTNVNGIQYDKFDNIYIQTQSQIIVINKASTVNNLEDIVEYTSTSYNTPSFFKENAFALNLNATGLAMDKTGETIYWTDGIQINRSRIPYRANKGGRMYNNIMDYLTPDLYSTIFTEGQKDRMLATIQAKRSQMLASDGYVNGGYCPAGLPLAVVGLPYVTNLTCNAVKIQWDKNPCVDSYTLRYRKKGTTAWSFKWNIPASKTSYVLNTVNASLEPETAYQYQVLCKKAGFSDSQSIIGEFITKSVADCRDDLLEEETNTATGSDILIYPNPNSGKFTVRLEDKGGDDDVFIRVINLSGQIVYETRYILGESVTAIDLNLDVPAGYYSVIVVNSANSISKGIIISR